MSGRSATSSIVRPMRDRSTPFGQFVWRRWRAWFLFALGLALYLPLVGSRDIVTSHEGRVAQAAREMAASGWPWAAREVEVPATKLMRREDGALRLAPAPDEPPIHVNPWLV